jgi:hypothetical protein
LVTKGHTQVELKGSRHRRNRNSPNLLPPSMPSVLRESRSAQEQTARPKTLGEPSDDLRGLRGMIQHVDQENHVVQTNAGAKRHPASFRQRALTEPKELPFDAVGLDANDGHLLAR